MPVDKARIMEVLEQSAAYKNGWRGTKQIQEVPDVPDVADVDTDTPDDASPDDDAFDALSFLNPGREEVEQEAPDTDEDEDEEDAGLQPDVTADEGVPERPQGLTAEDIAALRSQAERGANLSSFISEHPGEAARLILAQLSDAQKQALGVAQTNAPAPLADVTLDVDYNDLSSAEKLAYDTLSSKDTREFLRSGKTAMENYAANTAEALNKTNATLTQSILERDYEIATLETMVETMAGLMGIQLPPRDVAAVNELLAKGVPVKDAVKQAYGTKLAEIAKKAKGKPPSTPKSVSNGSSRKTNAYSLVDIMAEMGAKATRSK